MKRLLSGLAILPFVAGIALAQEPMKLTSHQMDKVTAGWDLLEVDVSNTSQVLVAVYPSSTVYGAINTLAKPANCGCYLTILSPAFSVLSAFGPPG